MSLHSHLYGQQPDANLAKRVATLVPEPGKPEAVALFEEKLKIKTVYLKWNTLGGRSYMIELFLEAASE